VSGADPFGTAALREAVLATWAASPDRFREDANAEEDLALGGYRDRVVVELAQNAADAASRAGAPGRLLLRLDDGVLVAANTGAPLDAAGVRALASLRASAKREDAGATGRFGVGFAAVLAVTDAPQVVRADGVGVAFSQRRTAALVAERAPGALAREVTARAGHVPVLRLPWPAGGQVPEGFDTAVVLPLRDPAAVEAVTAQLAAVGDALLLALPALAEVVVELPGAPPRRVAGVGERWHVLRRTGRFRPADLADRPTEERQRLVASGWSVTWALPRDPSPGSGHLPVVHAPTPTDEPLPWPALLVASLPLEASRRSVAPGPATDAVLAGAAAAFVALLTERAAAGDDVLPLVPVGLPAGELDAALREQALALLPAAPVLRAVEDAAPLRPRDAVALEGALADDPAALAALAPLLAGLVTAPARAGAALRALGVRRLSVADVVDALPPTADPAAWAARAGALAAAALDPVAREQLGALPVPLADGRTVRGVRGAVLGAPGCPASALALLARHGLRVVDPEVASSPAATALLERLGARTLAPRALLEDPALAAAVALGEEGEEDGGDPEEVADAVLGLVAAAVADGALRPGDLPGLGDLLLADAEGEPVPAAGLVLPGSPASALLDPEEVGVVAPDLLRRWGAPVLEAAGVAAGLAVLRWADVDPDDPPEALADLDGAERWLDDLAERAADAGLAGAVAAEVVAVRDLDLVRPGVRAELLAAVAADPGLRAAVVAPVRLVGADGAGVDAPGHAAWWLARRLGLRGRAAAGAPAGLAALLPAVPAGAAAVLAADPELARALGLVSTWDDLDADAWQSLLDDLADGRLLPPAPADLLALWRALADAAPDLRAPVAVAALDPDGRAVLAEAEDAVVCDAPMWLARTDLGARLVPGAARAAALADVLDLDLASERAAGQVSGGGREVAVEAAVRAALPGAPATWRRHERLAVDGAGVDWWVEGEGPGARVHAATTSGLARGLAQAAGAWGARLLVQALLAAPERAAAALVEESAG